MKEKEKSWQFSRKVQRITNVHLHFYKITLTGYIQSYELIVHHLFRRKYNLKIICICQKYSGGKGLEYDMFITIKYEQG